MSIFSEAFIASPTRHAMNVAASVPVLWALASHAQTIIAILAGLAGLTVYLLEIYDWIAKRRERSNGNSDKRS